MTDEPLVSVVVSVYNGARYIAESVRSALDQTWMNLELIVVDDGSTDDTPAVVAAIDDPRVRYVTKPNGGVSSARNRGMAEARGDYVAFLDGDDVWRPDKLTLQLAALRAEPDAAMAYCSYAITDAELRVRTVIHPEGRRLDVRRLVMLEGNGIGLGVTAVLRRSALEYCQGFDEGLSTSADLDFVCQVAEQFAIMAVPQPLALYRTHPGQMHTDMAAFEQDMRTVQDRYLRRWEGGRVSRRARANLYTRVFFFELVAPRPGPALRALGLALAIRPDRLVVLPLAAVGRRLRRRLRITLGRD